MSGSARVGTVVACAAAIAATACATILGIDDVSVRDGGANDASFLDVSSPDASADAPSGSGYAGAVMSDHPIAYWNFDDVGDTALDSTSNHLDVKYPPEVGHGPSIISGKGGSANFPGSPDGGLFGVGITRPPTPLLELSGPISVEAWIRPFLGNLSEIITYGQQSLPPFQPWGMQITPALELYTSCCSQVDGKTLLDTTNSTSYYVVATFDQSLGTALYVDGVRDNDDGGPGGSIGGYDTVNGLNIGVGNSGGLPFKGLIDEVAVYDHVLSPERILAHYTAGK